MNFQPNSSVASWTSLPKKKSPKKCVCAFPGGLLCPLKSFLKTSLPSDNVRVYNCTDTVSRIFFKWIKDGSEYNRKRTIHKQTPREEKIPPSFPSLQTRLISYPLFPPSFRCIKVKKPSWENFFPREPQCSKKIRLAPASAKSDINVFTIFRGTSMFRQQCKYTTIPNACQIFYYRLCSRPWKDHQSIHSKKATFRKYYFLFSDEFHKFCINILPSWPAVLALPGFR